jgi:cysteinyl-tRNA synthetase
MLKVFNSLTRKKQELKPLTENTVKMYVCGMTVYDFCHLGHARMLTAFDIITRYLRWRGFAVTYVRNITDIDDKIIKRAQDNKEDYFVLTERYINAMHEDLRALNLLPPEHEPKATQFVEKMVAMIEALETKGLAYKANNKDVYFNVRKFPNYGCLSHRDIDKLQKGARVEINVEKADPLDFVLWKATKPGEPSWDSPWGKGRPGWHIECSAMSESLLGDHFDIHGGGKDLIFPHHENEIAQSEGMSGKPHVNVWMHNGHVQINKEKMSKSLGNFFTIRDLLAKHDAEVVRYFLVSSHYRSPLHYSPENLVQARNSLERLYAALRDLDGGVAPVASEYADKFSQAMDDDFNTPIAFAVLFDLTHEIQRCRETDKAKAKNWAALLKNLAGVLGLLERNPQDFFQKLSSGGIDIDKIDQLIARSEAARADKDWAQADLVRKELAELHIILEDGPQGTTWKNIS